MDFKKTMISRKITNHPRTFLAQHWQGGRWEMLEILRHELHAMAAREHSLFTKENGMMYMDILGCIDCGCDSPRLPANL